MIEAASLNLIPAALMLLLPLGFILLTSSTVPQHRAPILAIQLLTAWAVAVLGYFAVGFAFQFGGIAQVSTHPDLQQLYWEWYPLGQSLDLEVARLWGLAALQGWGLAGPASTGGAAQLFAGHVSLVGLAALLPASILYYKKKPGLALLITLLTGTILYPLGGNWLWGGGWLSQLGLSLGLGHGFVDFGGASIIFLIGSLTGLIALLVFKPAANGEPPTEPAEVVVPIAGDTQLTVYPETAPSLQEILPVTPMPSAYLPLLGILGVILMLPGWIGLAMGSHTPTAINFNPAQAAVGGLLAALSAALAAAGYSWLTNRTSNPLMTSRGLMAGLVIALAGAPFIPPGILVLAGLGMGLLLPLLIYLFNQSLRLADELSIVATYGISAVVSLLLVSIFAAGQAGQGWNGVGLMAYQGVSGQGVSGLIVAAGYHLDWPGQFQAQLIGIAAIGVLALGLSFLVLQTAKVIQNAWAKSGLELVVNHEDK
jgi:Amt family ammonium transporter